MTDRCVAVKREVESTNASPSVKKARRDYEQGSNGSDKETEYPIKIKEETLHEDQTCQPILIQDVRTVKEEEEDSSKKALSARKAKVSKGKINKSRTNVKSTVGPTRTVKLVPELVIYPLSQDGTLRVEGMTRGKIDTTNINASSKVVRTYANIKKQILLRNPVFSKLEVDPLLIKRLKKSKEETLKNESWHTESSSMKTFDFTRTKSWLMPPTVEPADYFKHFINDDYLNEIVDATNQEALSKKDSRLNFVHLRNWTNVTISEMKMFLGLVLHTGTAKMTYLGDYWRQHWLFKSCFRDYMTPQRFTAILRFLTFPDCINDYDRIVDNFNSVMDKIYYPGRNLNLDINVTDWDHRTMYGQRDININKFGNARMITLCEQDGMIVKMAIEVRKSFDTEASVFKLLEGKLNGGHSLNVSDQVKITSSIATKLIQRKTYCTAVNVGDVPNQLSAEEVGPGQNRSLFRMGVHIGKYNSGSSTIYYLSTEFKDDMKQSKSSQFTEPVAICSHEEKYKAIERMDLFEYYPCEVQKLPRNKKIFVHSLMLSVLNANLLFNAFSGTTMNYFSYRLKVIEHLLPRVDHPQAIIVRTESRGVNTDYDDRLITANALRRKAHRLSKIPKSRERITEDGRVVKATARRQCKNCKVANNARLITVYECVGCKGSPAMCMDCFFDIHRVSV